MKKEFCITIYAGICLAMVGCTEKALPPNFEVSDIFRNRKVEFVQLFVKISPRKEELAKKLQEAAGKDPEWWLEHVKKAQPGQPIEYHPKTGLTVEEYEEFLDESDKPILVDSGIQVSAYLEAEDGLYRLRGFPSVPAIGGLRIDPSAGTLTMDSEPGVTANAEWRDSVSGGAIGPLTGYSWKYESGDSEFQNIRVIRLEVLRAKATGKVYWVFTNKEMVDGEIVTNHEIYLLEK